jgi:signal transduction histidine kinase
MSNSTSLATLEALAPPHLVNHRQSRYQGDDVCSAVSEFNPADQKTIRDLYRFLQELFEIVAAPAKDGRPAGDRLAPFLATIDLDTLTESIVAIGSDRAHYEKLGSVARTAHDIRGGGLTSLLNELYTSTWRIELPELARALFLLSRDHLKIMRNSLRELDEDKRNADLLPVMHSARLLIDKWDGTEIRLGTRTITTRVQHAYDGPISESCVEFGALDRVIYNLMNNAARHTADDIIRLYLLPFPDESETENLRIVVLNEISPESHQYLRTGSVEDDLRFLFEAGVSTTGSGLGMSIVADFVSNAYGIHNVRRALDGKYLGARLVEGQFAAWFHWPITAGV